MKKTISVAEFAQQWGIALRTVRHYCAQGKIPGATLVGKTWHIPKNALCPSKKSASQSLLFILQRERKHHISGGIYHRVQIDMTYNSNHMEGSQLSHEQTRYIFETNTIGISEQPLSIDDIVETSNHFRCIDLIIDNAKRPLSLRFIKLLHATLKSSTSDSKKSWFAVGEFKQLPNEVGGEPTTAPENVISELTKLVKNYNACPTMGLKELLDFHVRFERIHPFQDGNGRIGRLLLFKECLKHGITPFIIGDDMKVFYYRGLREWDSLPGYLTDTCLTAQDRFKTILDYFRIPYED